MAFVTQVMDVNVIRFLSLEKKIGNFVFLSERLKIKIDTTLSRRLF